MHRISGQTCSISRAAEEDDRSASQTEVARGKDHSANDANACRWCCIPVDGLE